jgi:hypothetical protein
MQFNGLEYLANDKSYAFDTWEASKPLNIV